ncbi:membrane dipeptidase [Pyrococcus furiosus DSM 3638]|nr:MULTISPECIES: dipeptidase [Pyrococcus]AFN03664.1 membrane dipeptidase [Pyrococcus furiosus COM1]MDK2869794.1 rane dipeptidase [Pyrococcus sp.]QEK78547.1 membrane dipeptidase [Pyrococcus furiosus DSM 3638]
MSIGVFDAHSDLPTYIYEERKNGKTRVLEEKFDEFFTGISARVMSIWSKPDKRPIILRYSLEAINRLYSDVAESQRFEIVRSIKEMEEAIKNDKVALWLGLEGGEPIESLDILEIFYSLGLRVLTLTWSLRNQIGDGVFERTNGGITNFGAEVIGKCEELGILIDVSHLNEAGFWDVLDITGFPVIASHSNAKSLCDNPRNLTDEQIKAIAERDGVVGITAVAAFVDKDNPTLEKFIAHVEHVVDLVGYKHVGFGFDFVYYLPEWSGKSVVGLENERRIPDLIERLKENFSEKEVKAIAFDNFKRVFDRVVG